LTPLLGGRDGCSSLPGHRASSPQISSRQCGTEYTRGANRRPLLPRAWPICVQAHVAARGGVDLTCHVHRQVGATHGGDHRGQLDISSCQPSRQGGTSREYTLARLKRDRPDLAELVIGGAMSANAAAIEAGFRRRDTPVDTLCRAWGKATATERAAFLHKIGARRCGDDTTADRHPPAPPPPWDAVPAADD